MAWVNIKMTEDRTRFYVDQHRQLGVFLPRQKVFLSVPHDSTKLSISVL